MAIFWMTIIIGTLWKNDALNSYETVKEMKKAGIRVTRWRSTGQNLLGGFYNSTRNCKRYEIMQMINVIFQSWIPSQKNMLLKKPVAKEQK